MWNDVISNATELKNFCWKHRNKFAVGTAVAVGVYAIYSSSSSAAVENSQPSKKKEKVHEVHRKMDYSKRIEVISRIRNENDTVIKYFLSIFRPKLNEVIDVSSLIRKLKDLREKQPEKKELETELWEEIKISAFSIVFVSSYLLSTLCVLVLIQMHILGCHTPTIDLKSPESSIENQSQDGQLLHLEGLI